MSDTRKTAGATYTRAAEGYFEKRKLKRSAGVWGLWGLAVAAVISGDFSGWNFGIDFAGFGGMLIAFAILVAMYYGMIFSIGEMAAAQPHTGGHGSGRDHRVRRDHRRHRVLLRAVRERDHK
jgi:ethanolamine permease